MGNTATTEKIAGKKHCLNVYRKRTPMIRFSAGGKKISRTWPGTACLMVALVIIGWAGIFPAALPPVSMLSPSVAVAGPSALRESPPPWPHEKSDLAPDPAITFGRFDNGFRYVLMKNQHPENRVSVHLYVRAGSLNETDEQQGLAHFLEHMMFNGSTHFPPGELVRYFQSIGMQFGNDANAHTGFNETVYDIILPTGGAENLKTGLLVMHDYATGALLLNKEVKREAGVILAEKRSRDSAAYRTFKATLKFELPDFLVSRRLPIGKTTIIRNADKSRLKAFYDGWYRPDEMVLVMVGDFSIPLAEKLIDAQFSDFAPRTSTPALPALGAIAHKGLDVFNHYEPEAGGTTVSIEVIRPHSPVPDSLAFERRQMIENMADRMIQNRLDTRLKAPGAPFTAAAVGSGIYLNRIRYAEISADSSAENWREALAAIEQELRRARLFGFSQEELARVRKDVLKELDNAVKEAPTRNSTAMARSIIRDLAANQVIQSPEQEKRHLAPIVKAVTLDDVHQALEKTWPNGQRLVLVTGNADLKRSSAKPPKALIRDVFLASAGTVVHPPEAGAAAKFPYLPDPKAIGTIASREELEDLGVTRIQLGNGIRLNLKRTDYKTNEVLANLIFGHGKSAEPRKFPGLSLLAERTVNESGLGAMDSDALERALAGKSTYMDFRIEESYFNFFAESVSSEVNLLFQLIHAHLTDPAFRDDALTLARERLHQDYLSSARSIEGMMKIEGRRILAGGDSRFGMPSFDKIKAIHLDDIRNWIAPQLAHAPLELSIVGDFDKNEVIALARRYLGSLPQRQGPIAVPRKALPRLPTGTVNRIEVDTQIPKALVVTAWPTDDFWDISRTRRLSVLADIFSDRLRERIREKLGASYSPYAFNQSSRAYPGYGVFQAYVNVAPDQADAVLAEVKAIAANLVRNGVGADELTRAIDPILTSIKEFRQTNGYWLNSVMTASARHPDQFEWARTFVKDYAAVTTNELAALAATYLAADRASVIIIKPKADAMDTMNNTKTMKTSVQ
jgi:zinc protease